MREVKEKFFAMSKKVVLFAEEKGFFVTKKGFCENKEKKLSRRLKRGFFALKIRFSQEKTRVFGFYRARPIKIRINAFI